MNHVYRNAIYGLLLILAAGLLSCADSGESRFRPIPSGQAAVIISLNLPPEDPTAFDDTIWNRIRRLFVRDAVAQTAPATFASISVTVTAPDIATVQQTFLPTDTMLLNLPAGDARRFDVLATVDPADPSAALSFSGTATASLTEGTTVSLPVSMTLSETRLVVPDNRNNRIVKINSMAGDGWVSLTGANIGFSQSFQPYDIDFDSRGRIYIANNFASTGGNVVIRINNLADTSCIVGGNGGGSGIAAVAVDRVRNFVYYSNSLSLRRITLDLNGANDTAISISGATVNNIRGIDVDQASGNVYLACTLGSAAAVQSVALLSISGTSATVTASQALIGAAGTTTSSDVLVKPPLVFVAESLSTNPNTNNRIIQFDMGLTIAAASAPFLDQIPSATPAQFFGPDRFIAPPNRRLVVIDEDQSGVPNDRLIGFDDITGTNPATFGTAGLGVGQFHFLFWNGC